MVFRGCGVKKGFFAGDAGGEVRGRTSVVVGVVTVTVEERVSRGLWVDGAVV